MKTLKLAFIGGSNQSIAGRPHYIASRMDNRFELVAGAFSTNSEINRKTAAEWSVERIYDDWRDLISRERSLIDALVILTPTPIHKDIVIQALKADIPIICEKPLAATLDEIREIEAVFNPNQHFLAVTNNYSGYPMVRELRQMIEDDQFGRLLHMRLEMPQESFLRPPKSVKYPQKWRLTDGYIPMISLDLGTHLHHLAKFLSDKEPSSVFADYQSFSKYKVVDDVNIRARYDDGMSANFWLSKTALGNRNGLKISIYGEEGSAVWMQEYPEKLNLAKTDGRKITIDRGGDLSLGGAPEFNRMTPGHPAGFIEAFANLYSDIHGQLLSFKEGQIAHSDYVYGLSHAKNGLTLLHGASHANESNQWVDLKF